MPPKVKPLNNNVLIELEPLNETVDGLISDVKLFKPNDANEHVFRIGKVVAVGPGRWNKKRTARLPMDAEVGMRILFIKFVATHTEQAKQIQREFLGEEFALIKDNDILADIGDTPLSRISQ